MENAIIAAFVGFTSIICIFFGKHFLSLQTSNLPRVILLLVETIGVSITFLLINILIGFVALLTLRIATPIFVPMYLLWDTSWVMASFIQAFIFQCWRGRLTAGSKPENKSD